MTAQTTNANQPKGKTLLYHDGKPETLEQRATRLEAELAEAKAKNGPKEVTMKVAEKGGLSLYGIGRFPVTLYREQWERVLDMADSIRAFIKDHDKELKKKGE